jgi:hypothetical protein
MNWFKNIFVDNKKEIEVKNEVENELKQSFNFKATAKLYFSGLDLNFINFIYFQDVIEKNKFISDVEKLLYRLKINEKTDIETGKKLIADYYFDDNEKIPFLNEILCYNLQKTTTYLNVNNSESSEKSIITNLEDIKKLDNYYIALNLCLFNIQKKINAGSDDFKFEKELIYKTLEENELFNFARIDTLFCLGAAYYKANQIESMEIVFNRIHEEKYELSLLTIADYYRSIGEIYIDLKQIDKALYWLKSGVNINPKLGVKKIIDQLEKLNNSTANKDILN